TATIEERPAWFRVEEQFLFTPAVELELEHLGVTEDVAALLAADRPPWTTSHLDDNVLVERVRVAPHAHITFWRPTTPLEVHIPSLDLGSLVVQRARSSTVLLKAQKDLVEWTDPPSSSGGAIALGTPGDLRAVGAIRVGARPSWARNPAAQKV